MELSDEFIDTVLPALYEALCRGRGVLNLLNGSVDKESCVFIVHGFVVSADEFFYEGHPAARQAHLDLIPKPGLSCVVPNMVYQAGIGQGPSDCLLGPMCGRIRSGVSSWGFIRVLVQGIERSLCWRRCDASLVNMSTDERNEFRGALVSN